MPAPRSPIPTCSLTPGEFARIRVAVAPPAPALMVPDAAVLLDQSQHIVHDRRRRRHRRARSPSRPATCATGCASSAPASRPSDRVIIDGMVRAVPGGKVDAAGRHDRLQHRRRRAKVRTERRHAPDAHLHRPADLRDRPQRLRDPDRARRARRSCRSRNIRRSCRRRSRSRRSIRAPRPRPSPARWRRRSSSRSTASRTCST